MKADLHAPGKAGQQAAKEHLQALASLDQSIGPGYRAVFVSSGEEAVAQVFWTVYCQAVRELGKNHVLISKWSGRSVVESAARLESLGAVIKHFDDDCKDHLSVRTALISSPLACQVSGIAQPVDKIASMRQGALFHLDITAALGRLWIDIDHLSPDFMTYEGKQPGTGALFIREHLNPEPLIVGSEEQRGWRAGRFDPIQCLTLANEIKEELENTHTFVMEHAEKKELFMARLGSARFFPNDLPHILLFEYEGLHAEWLAYHLDNVGLSLDFGGGRTQPLENLMGSPLVLSLDLTRVDLVAADVICEVARSLKARSAL